MPRSRVAVNVGAGLGLRGTGGIGSANVANVRKWHNPAALATAQPVRLLGYCGLSLVSYVNGTCPGEKTIEAADARQQFSDEIDNIAKRLSDSGRLRIARAHSFLVPVARCILAKAVEFYGYTAESCAAKADRGSIRS